MYYRDYNYSRFFYVKICIILILILLFVLLFAIFLNYIILGKICLFAHEYVCHYFPINGDDIT